MPTLSATATLEQADDFNTDYSGGNVIVRDGATVLATHPITSFTTENSGANATATAVFPSGGVVTASATGTADNCTLEDSLGIKVITLTIGSDITINPLTFTSGQDSTINSLVITFPA